MSDPVFTLERGTTPLLLSLPHVGTAIADDLVPALVPRVLALEDTDWHLAEVYDFARQLGASVLVPRYSRYVIDLNRPPENAPMYPGEREAPSNGGASTRISNGMPDPSAQHSKRR
jgi:N-formylglutamate deformylase